ncbi:exostosin-1 [Chrysoperla carnea]|uniref:exostosin-1 n=1 Tax=Chrysoperla carnea TaxID=189513 RepID=UPI001D06B927|nr:exostosin-1 [Chrysoperla carnea]
MQAKKRYLLVLLSCAFLAYCYFGGYRLKSHHFISTINTEYDQLKCYTSSSNSPSVNEVPPIANKRWMMPNNNYKECRMETCFDYNRCSPDHLKVYVYPQEQTDPTGTSTLISASYQKILSVLLESRYITTDPSEACLFILSLDTLDRDPLSADYVRNMPARIQRLPLWNNGLNHVIFNLYSGTWPDYAEDSLGFDYGLAILAKASISNSHLRPGFDISIPLFHKKHAEKGGEPGYVQNNRFPSNKKYLLAFKGKRYVHGIGSETRNALFHLHNDHDLIMVTTCRHGKSWKELKDDRCDEDNLEYDRYDYDVLLQNSTFCLVPRGRRLGSFRFLEALQAGCIPVILSNDWALPFQQVIDWSKAVIWADERLLLQVPDIVRSITPTDILEMRQQTQILWQHYFSSIEKIIFTTLEIIKERIPSSSSASTSINKYRDGYLWNTHPGGLLTLPQFSDSWWNYPFYLKNLNQLTTLTSTDINKFTCVIYCHLGMPLTPTSSLYRLIKNVSKSKYIVRLIIVWVNDKSPPSSNRWPVMPPNIPMNILPTVGNIGTNSGAANSATTTGISQRFYPHSLIQTAGVLSLDEDSLLTTDEIDFAFQVWREFPERIVGYPARSHYWDDSKSSWGYTSKWTNDYSIVLTGAAFYHRYYNVLYTHWLNPLLHKTVEQSQNCEDILMNFLVSHVTRRPPIKVTQRKQYKEQQLSGVRSPWNDPDHFVQRQTCLNTFAAVFGYMPLLRSNLRLDPVLFKDPVSNLRKKYRQIERVGS